MPIDSPQINDIDVRQSFDSKIYVLARAGKLSDDELQEIYSTLATDPDAAYSIMADLYHERHTLESPLYPVLYQTPPHDRVVSNLFKSERTVRGKGFFALYSYVLDLENTNVLMDWRDEVDAMIDSYRKSHEEGGNFAHDHIAKNCLGEDFDNYDLILYCISKFVREHKSPWHKWVGYFNAILRTITPIRGQLSNFGVKSDFCVDVCAVTNYLAATYGCYGSIESGHGATGQHHIWREDGDGGRIIDINACPHLNGFVRDPKKHKFHETVGTAWKENKSGRYKIECGEYLTAT